MSGVHNLDTVEDLQDIGWFEVADVFKGARPLE